MNQRGFSSAIILIIVGALVLGAAGYFIFARKTGEPQLVVQPRVENLESQARSAVEKVLSTSSIVPKNSKLLSLSVDGNNVTLDFSKDIMNNGQGAFEDVFQQISNTLHPIIQGTGKDQKYSGIDYMILIEGVPLDTYLETANWKTYRNEQYGFEVKYPSGWKAENRQNGRIDFLSDHNSILEMVIYPWEKSVNEFLGVRPPLVMSTTTFLGFPARYVNECNMVECRPFFTTLEILNGKLVYSLGYSIEIEDDNAAKTAQAIISTFKFTK